MADQPEIKENPKFENFTSKIGRGLSSLGGFPALMGVFGIPMMLFYSVTAILASPFLGLGLALKKIALATNEKADTYHHL